ncbi:cytochrome P460 family protein [Caulobacter sp. UNC358MFTsu5.1]|uniref:cytochrome P460 family protein n=1 Tax=Caulobacter sp. UNC358MFTsu5.1 TaxID=1449049 RepID=UPI0004A6E2CF|nr:cytochrome P460 family protein [Caulobacter sp. UNC358MFTsu5.1]
MRSRSEPARRSVLFGLAACLVGGACLAASATAPDYPVGYRHWTHVKSGVIGPGSPAHPRFGGLHHIYANPKAMRGYSTGKFAPGSVLVFDVLEAKQGAGSVEGGERRFVDVMTKSRDGWSYTEFNGDSREQRNVTPEAGVSQCQSCHLSPKTQDQVFSRFKE